MTKNEREKGYNQKIKEKGVQTIDVISGTFLKLDEVGPVDNRPSTDKLHHFVQKKKKEKKVTCDPWHVTHDMWHMTRDMWHVTHDMWHVVGGEHSLKISAP